MPHMHRPPLNLRQPHEAWLVDLAKGDASAFREGIDTLSADDRFLLGVACAIRGHAQGISLLLGVLPAEDKQPMGIHWLETAILHENHGIAELLRVAGVDACAPFDVRRSFEGGGLFQRRNSWASSWLEQLDAQWDDEFAKQWRNSRLPDLFLHRAIHHNSVETVAFLLDQGAPLNTSHEAHLPLWAALRAGKAPVMQLLIDRGARVDLAGQCSSKTLVVAAAERGLGACVWLLVSAGASLSDRSCGIDAPCAARAAGHALLASEMEASALMELPKASGLGSPRRL